MSACHSTEPRAEAEHSPGAEPVALVVLTGNPNCGKTTLFNALTGLRAKVGNYSGVTVERKEGVLLGSPPGRPITVLDLPGAYSLSPQSLDEQIVRDVLFQRLPGVGAPTLVVVVVDASNLERNLYYATQVLELGYPTLVALNMTDVAEQNGHQVDARKLATELGVPVLPIVASRGEGLPALRQRLLASRGGQPGPGAPKRFCVPPEAFELEVKRLSLLPWPSCAGGQAMARAAALLALGDERNTRLESGGSEWVAAVAAARGRLEAAGVDWRTAAIEARYRRVAAIHAAVVSETAGETETSSDKLDRLLTHKVWGMLIFLVLMALMFQSIFTFAKVPMNALEAGVGWIGDQVGRLLPPGDLHSLLVDGVIAGVGAVVVFVPQICLLFLFIGVLEDTGYMARAAFLMDRLMSKVGLHGKSFIPMLSSFACAIPGILATRTIESPKDRLATILIAPLMSCSARLPVYTLLIAACLPERRVWGLFKLSGLTMLGMYLLGVLVALSMAWVLKRTLLKGATPMLILELPPYKRPVLRRVLRHTWDRAWQFLSNAGTIILGFNILLWFLASYPRDTAWEQALQAKRAEVVRSAAPLAERESALRQLDNDQAGHRIRHSLAGRLGRLIEPVLEPLGFDWKIGIGIVSSFAAREIFVSTMSVVYNMGAAKDPEAAAPTLAQTLRVQTRADGTRMYTPLVGVTLMVFYVLALQCVSTVAVVRRETGSWKWPLFQWAYMGGLAWLLAFVAYQGGKLLGLE